MEAIERLWREHLSERFPYGMGGREIAGVCITSLDAEIAGCVTSYLGRRPTDPRRGTLDAARLEVLRRRRGEFDRVVPNLPPDARPYFERLALVADSVLNALAAV